MKKITKKRLAEIKAFKNMDFSDCPVLTDEQLTQMKPSHLRNREKHEPKKIMIIVSLDVNVLEWLQNTGKGWQTRMNAISREVMLHAQL
jgi:uncharacterized protein (DUF4415 family)